MDEYGARAVPEWMNVPFGTCTAETNVENATKSAVYTKNGSEVGGVPSQPATDDDDGQQDDAGHEDRVDDHRLHEAHDPAGQERSDPLPEERLDASACPRSSSSRTDRSDPEDPAGRRRGRDRAEDRQLASPPRRHDQEEQAQRRRAPPTTAIGGRLPGPPGSPSDREEDDGEGDARRGSRRSGRASPVRPAGRTRRTIASRPRSPRAPSQSAPRTKTWNSEKLSGWAMKTIAAGSATRIAAPSRTSDLARASPAIAQVIGVASAPMRANGSADAQGVGPIARMNGTWTIDASGIQWALLGIGRLACAGSAPPTSTNVQMKSMLNPCPAASWWATFT